MRYILTGVVVLLSFPAMADRTDGPVDHSPGMCMWLDTEAMARQAAEMLKPGSTIQYYFSKSEDKTGWPIRIERVVVQRVEGRSDWEIRINGNQVLEPYFTYVQLTPNAPWNNQAALLKCIEPKYESSYFPQNPRVLPSRLVSHGKPATKLPD